MAYTVDNFESQKNVKASAYTLAIVTLIVLLLLFITWTLPAPPMPPVDDGIEVNLGNSDKGLGTDQPYLPGKPSAQDHQKYTPAKPTVTEKAPLKDVETNDNDKEETPVVKKPLVTKPDATKIPDKEVTPKVVKAAKPVENPAPVKPKPKAVFNGVNDNGKGGNDADTYKPGGNQGIAGGKGDQGKPGGNPNSDNYNGNGGTGHSGITKRGLVGRNIVNNVSFTGDFNENAHVAIDVHVDASGNVTSTDFNMRGSTTSESSLVSQAVSKAKQVKFNSGSGESFGTLIFNFKVHN
jgi:hypothetical protein